MGYDRTSELIVDLEKKTKTCACCKTEKEISEFGNNKQTKDGKCPYCKVCARNKSKQYAKDNPERVKASYKKYANANRLARRATTKASKLKNAPAVKSYNALYSKTHRDVYRKADKKYAEKHPDKMAEKSKRNYAQNKDQIRASVKAWRKSNPLAVAMQKARRKARQKNVVNNLDVNQWKWLLDLCKNKCLACGSVDRIECDHVIPLLPGTHTLNNVQPLCRTCNNCKKRIAIDYRPKHIREAIDCEMIELGLSQ